MFSLIGKYLKKGIDAEVAERSEISNEDSGKLKSVEIILAQIDKKTFQAITADELKEALLSEGSKSISGTPKERGFGDRLLWGNCIDV